MGKQNKYTVTSRLSKEMYDFLSSWAAGQKVSKAEVIRQIVHRYHNFLNPKDRISMKELKRRMSQHGGG